MGAGGERYGLFSGEGPAWPTGPGPFARLRARIEPERFTKRGILRIQMWGNVATILALYPAWALAADGAPALQEPGVVGTTGGAVIATLFALRAFFEFLTASAKRAEKRASEATAPHEHPEIGELQQDLATVVEQQGIHAAKIAGIEKGQALIHIDLQNMRDEYALGQRNMRSDMRQNFSEVKGMVSALIEMSKKEPS